MLNLSRAQVETCGLLLGADALPPSAVAERLGVNVWTVYKRRQRAERALGQRLPRYNRYGRPPGQLPSPN